MNKRSQYKPYIGARPFDSSKEDRERFEGRYFETQRIISYIYSHSVTLIYAPSGSGKTSLLNASIIPKLKEKDFDVLPVGRVQHTATHTLHPEKIVNQYIFNALLRFEPDINPDHITNKTLKDFLKTYPRSSTNENTPSPRLIVFDQFEEIFTIPTDNWKAKQVSFFKQIRDAIEDDKLLRIVFIIREEYACQLEEFGYLLPESFRIRYRLGLLSKENAEIALTEPLKKTHRHFSDGVAKKIIADISKIKWTTNDNQTREIQGETVEPVHLQLVGKTLWENLPDDVTTIESKHVKQFGDVDKILKDYYESSIQSIIKSNVVTEAKLRSWINTKLITTANTRNIAFRGLKDTQGIPNQVVDQLENRHIIRAEERAGGQWYELTHDRWVKPIKDSNSQWRVRKSKQKQKYIVISLSSALLTGIIAAPLYFDSLFLNPSLVPNPEKSKLVNIEEKAELTKPDYGNFNIIRDIRVLDFRSRKKLKIWQHKHDDKYSPVTWMRYTLAKKINPEAEDLIFRFGTSGYGVFPRSLTHKYNLEVNKTDLKLHPNKSLKEVWHVITNVSKEKNNEFLSITEATFWNAFQGKTEWASITAADTNTKEIGISMIFPEKNPHKNIKLYKNSKISGERILIAEFNPDKNFNIDFCSEEERKKHTLISKDEELPLWTINGCISTLENGVVKNGRNCEEYQFYTDSVNRTIFWSIKNPSINFRYDVSWDWDDKLQWWEKGYWD